MVSVGWYLAEGRAGPLTVSLMPTNYFKPANFAGPLSLVITEITAVMWSSARQSSTEGESLLRRLTQNSPIKSYTNYIDDKIGSNELMFSYFCTFYWFVYLLPEYERQNQSSIIYLKLFSSTRLRFHAIPKRFYWNEKKKGIKRGKVN